MGSISPRLARLYEAVNPSVGLPVIVSTTRPVDATILNQARTTGAQIGSPINFGNAYTATANKQQADAIAAQAGTAVIHPDEPIVAFPGAPR